MQERRKFTRMPEKLQISYRILPQAKSQSYITKDISQRGISFFSQEFVTKGSLLKIKLTVFQQAFSLEAIVIVKWVREDCANERYEIGVEFVNLSEEAAKHLVAYLNSISKNGAHPG